MMPSRRPNERRGAHFAKPIANSAARHITGNFQQAAALRIFVQCAIRRFWCGRALFAVTVA